MIDFSTHKLHNGLTIIHHKDTTTPMVALNILYKVGSRNEKYERTGFAHLFEHLMFGGSVNIADYDQPLQNAGGENNAFTNNDITNYYLTIPADNIETGFWLESDRMLSLAFSQKSLDTQKHVVIEEFKQRYLNQPYGDIPLLLRPLAYKTHSYRWPTIGKSTDDIAEANLEEVKSFFFSHYAPNNAILVVAGNIDEDRVLELSEKWFGSIEQRDIQEAKIASEPQQQEPRFLEVERNVPQNAIYKAYHMCSRRDDSFHATDLLSDVLSNGNSARLYQSLVKKKRLFTEINAYISDDYDSGLFYITGKLSEGVSLEDGNKAIQKEIEQLINEGVSAYELQKVKNKVESTLVFSETNYLNKAMNLAYHEFLGGANGINEEISKYKEVSGNQIIAIANKMLIENNCSTLYYKAENK